MAGLVKAKKYNWKDSNMAKFGSKEEREVKKASAMGEPAWENAGTVPGIQVWRIVKFQVTHWPKEQYGEFYNGDSYIVLKTSAKGENSNELDLHVHFWIGEYSTQDEYGTAAYKTVELDTLLDDRAVQHREVQGHESKLFKSYFDTFVYLKGGADTGFRHVTPEVYRPRLLHFCGTRRSVEVVEVKLNKALLNDNDVFILDLGMEIYQWNGKGSNKDERFKAMTFVNQLKDERTATLEVLEQDRLSLEHKFYTQLSDDETDEPSDDEGGEDDDENKLFKLSDAGGSLEMTKVGTGKFSYDDFKSEDVFLLHAPTGVFVWVGKGASPDEKKNGMSYGHNYLQKQTKCWLPIEVIREGCQSADFELAMVA